MQNNIETPEFWEQVKSDFEQSNENYLCRASEVFRLAWYNNNENGEILKPAKKFLRKNKKWCGVFSCGFVSIFDHELQDAYLHYRAVRLEFIDYMITKTKSQQHEQQN